MKIITPLPQDFRFKFAYSANLFCNAPSTEIFVENPVSKPEVLPFDTPESFATKLGRELKALKKPQIVAVGFSYELFNDNHCDGGIFGIFLNTCSRYGFPVALTTSSAEILDYLAPLRKLASNYCAVAVKIPSADDSVLQLMQPGFPLFKQRLQIIRQLSEANIKTGVWVNPILPYINDNAEQFSSILEAAAGNGASFAVYQKKLRLTPESRANLFDNIGLRFPQHLDNYSQLFSTKDESYGSNFMALSNTYARTTRRCGLQASWPEYNPPQLSLF